MAAFEAAALAVRGPVSCNSFVACCTRMASFDGLVLICGLSVSLIFFPGDESLFFEDRALASLSKLDLPIRDGSTNTGVLFDSSIEDGSEGGLMKLVSSSTMTCNACILSFACSSIVRIA